MEKKENKNLQKRKRDKSLKKKKHKEIDSESLSEYESISEGSEDIVEEVEVEENENEINTNSKKEKDKNKEHVNLWDEQNLNKLKNNEVLDFDNNAYEMLHRSKVEWPCLSIDFLIPENFDKSNLKSFYSPNSERNLTEDKYPYTTYMIAGSQTNEKNGYLYYMKWYGMYKTKYDDDPDKGFDSDDEEGKNPYMKYEKVKLNGNINRIKSMKNSFISAIWTDYPSIEIIDISELISSINDQESISIENEYKIDIKKRKISPKNTIIKSFPQKNEGFALDWNNINPFILASGGYDNTLNIYIPSNENVSDMIMLPQNNNKGILSGLTGHTNSIEDIQWSPNQENVLCTCSIDKSIRFWDLRQNSNKSPIIINNAHESDVNVISWNNIKSNTIASGGDDNCFKVWDIRFLNEGPISNIKWHRSAINSLMWDPFEESQIAVSSEDDRLSIWDFSVEADEKKLFDNFNMEIPQQLVFLHQGQKNLKDVKFHPYFKNILCSTAENGINLFKPGFEEDNNDDDLNDYGSGEEREEDMEIENS